MTNNHPVKNRALKGLSILLTCALLSFTSMLLLLLPNTASAYYSGDWNDLLKAAKTDGGIYKLTENLYTNEAYTSNGLAGGLVVEQDLTIDLNGFTLRIEIYTSDKDFNGITIANGVKLTIMDSSYTGTGTGTGVLEVHTRSTVPLGIGYGAGINTTEGELVIESGRVKAAGGFMGAGIGGGRNGSGGIISIKGGTVLATGGASAAGIGGGYNGTSGTITITGGYVSASGGYGSDRLDYARYTEDAGGGSGIGSGGSGTTSAVAVDTIVITTDDSVITTGGDSSINGGTGSGIGQGGYLGGNGAGILSFSIDPKAPWLNAGERVAFGSTLSLTGDSFDPEVGLQWQVSSVRFPPIFENIPGATYSSYLTDPVIPYNAGWSYRCVLTLTENKPGFGSITFASSPSVFAIYYQFEDCGLIFNVKDGKFYLDGWGDGRIDPFFDYSDQLDGWSWDSATHTLTLNDFWWMTPAPVALYVANGSWITPLTLNLQGSNTIASRYLGSGYSYGIKGSGLDLIVEGDGKLYVDGGRTPDNSAGLSYANITVNSGELSACGGVGSGISMGIETTTLHVTGGLVVAAGGDAKASFGVWASEVTVSGGHLHASSVLTWYGDSEGIRIRATYGHAGDLNVSGGKVTAFAFEAGGGRSTAISLEGTLYLSNNSQIYAWAHDQAIAFVGPSASYSNTMQAYEYGSSDKSPYVENVILDRLFFGIDGVPVVGSDPAYTFPASDTGFWIEPLIMTTVTDATVIGTAGTALDGSDTIDIILYGATFDSGAIAGVSDWLGNLPAGVSVSAEIVDSMTVRLAFVGTPSEAGMVDVEVSVPWANSAGAVTWLSPVSGTVQFEIGFVLDETSTLAPDNSGSPALGNTGAPAPTTGDNGISTGALALFVLNTGLLLMLVRARRIVKQRC